MDEFANAVSDYLESAICEVCNVKVLRYVTGDCIETLQGLNGIIIRVTWVL